MTFWLDDLDDFLFSSSSSYPLLHEPYILHKCTFCYLILLLMRMVLLASFFRRKEDVSLFREANLDTSTRIKFHLEYRLRHRQGVEWPWAFWFYKCSTFSPCLYPTHDQVYVHYERTSHFILKQQFRPEKISLNIFLSELCLGKNPWPSGKVSCISYLGNLGTILTSTFWTVWPALNVCLHLCGPQFLCFQTDRTDSSSN